MELWPPAMPTWGRPPSAVQSSAARLHGSRPHASGFRTLASSNAHLELWTPAMPTWGRPPSAVRSSAARLLGSKLQAPRFRLQNSGLQHCPRGDGRPRPSSRAQLDSSAPGFSPNKREPKECPRNLLFLSSWVGTSNSAVDLACLPGLRSYRALRPSDAPLHLASR